MKKITFFKKFLTKKNLFWEIPLILIIGFTIFKILNPKKPVYDFFIAKKGNLIQEVSVTGNVKPAESVDLAFEKGGKVANVYVDIGSMVSQGQLLARLNTGEENANLLQSQASYQKALVELDEIKMGTRPEEIAIEESKVESASVAFNESKKSVVDKIVDAYAKSDDSVRTKVDVFFQNPRGSSPEILVTFNDQSLKNKIETERNLVEKTLVSWQTKIIGLTTISDLNSDVDLAKSNLNIIKNFLDDTASGLNSAVPTLGISQTTIDTWKTNVGTARTNVATAITSLLSAEEKMRNAKIALTLAENNLALKKAGFTPNEILAQEALVKQAAANVESIKAQIAKAEVRAPINGVISKKEIKAGEIITAGKVAFSLISESKYEIETNVAEADFAKIKIGETAKVTFDAYGSDVEFDAIVTKIDPAETVIGGISTYKTTLQLTKDDSRIVSGLTANIDILAASKADVLVVPQRAVYEIDNKKFVRLLENNIEKEVEVKTGLRGSDGNIEIIDGVKENDKVITSTSNK